MSLLEQEMYELRQMIKNYDAGLITDQNVDTKMKMYGQMEKREAHMIKIMVFAKNKRALVRLDRKNLIGETTAINDEMIDSEREKVKCPGLNFDLIERHQCLDYSGVEKFAECNGCETGLATKRLLLAKAVEPPRMQEDGKL